MSGKIFIKKAEIDNLLARPLKAIMSRIDQTHFTAEIIVPKYQENIERHYYPAIKCDDADHKFAQFGLKITFSEPFELSAYDKDFFLSPHLKGLIATFGLVLFENAYFCEQQRKDGQKNIFPSLAFHVDRGASFENQYSLFVRDPFDEEQKFPRKSGTIILSNQVAKMQGQKEELGKMDMCSRYDLYTKERVEESFGKIMAYQGWSAPTGVGEICIFDNRTVLHASYFTGDKGGYKIGVRYLY